MISLKRILWGFLCIYIVKEVFMYTRILLFLPFEWLLQMSFLLSPVLDNVSSSLPPAWLPPLRFPQSYESQAHHASMACVDNISIEIFNVHFKKQERMGCFPLYGPHLEHAKVICWSHLRKSRVSFKNRHSKTYRDCYFYPFLLLFYFFLWVLLLAV